MRVESRPEMPHGGTAPGILRNSVFVLSARGLQIASSFIVFVAVARYLTVEQYGDYAFIVAFVSALMALSYFGIQQALIREIAKDKQEAPMLIGAAIRLRLVLSSLAAAVLVVSMFYMDLTSVTVAAGLVAIASEMFLTFSMLSRAVFQAYERMVYEPLLTFSSSLVLLAGVTVVILADLGFLWLFAAAAMANALQLFLAGNIMSRKFVKPSIRVDRGVFRRLLADAVVIGFGVFCYQNLFKINVIMLKWFGSTEDVSFFQVPHNMVMQIEVIPLALMTALFPVMSRLMHSDPAKVRDIYERTFRHLLVFSVFMGIILFVFAGDIIDIFFGAKYASSVSALVVIAWGVIPLSLDMLLNSMLLAMHKQKYILMYAGATLFIDALAAYIFVPSYGFMAASYIAVFSYMLLFAFSFTLVRINNMRIPVGRTAASTFFAVLLSGAAGIFARGFSLPIALVLCIALYFSVQFFSRTLVLGELRSLRGGRKVMDQTEEL